MRLAPLLLLAALAACRAVEAPTPPDVPERPAGAAVPEGMAYVPGGTTRIGAEAADPSAEPAERPAFDAAVDPFYLDRSPVTVARFAAFVDETGHATAAERVGDAGVFDPAAGWRLVPGADWRHPRGPGTPAAPPDHPVTQVAWADADAFCRWAGGRLPTEVEWEHAARGATNRRARYAWGDALATHDAHGDHVHANTWAGGFPTHDAAADGFAGTSPVGAFGETALGLTDLGGNVWEWTADWFRPYAGRDGPFEPAATSERVQRGGSFLCRPDRCHGFRVSARGHATPETALFHVGFRCARDGAASTA